MMTPESIACGISVILAFIAGLITGYKIRRNTNPSQSKKQQLFPQ